MNDSRTATHTDATMDTNAPRVSASFVLVVECERPTGGGARVLLSDLDVLTIGRGSARAFTPSGRAGRFDVADRFLSGDHVALERSGGRWTVRDLGSRNGTMVNGRRITEPTPLAEGDVVEFGHCLGMFNAAGEWLPTAQVYADAPAAGVGRGLETLAPGADAGLVALRAAAGGTLPVLLLGETGTGKEVLARRVHEGSGRAGAFVPVNCGALSQSLLEGQLFGHVKGAFTGAARDEPGLVRASDGGTLFLDEIGDLPVPAQASLLRVLQEREVTPVGATRPVPVDLRVVAATHRRLDLLAARGEFRADLYARLAGYTHALVPLRARRQDLGLLLAHLLPPRPHGPWTLAVEAARALLAHAWPMNIRELQQALALATTLAVDGHIRREHLPPTVLSGTGAVVAPPAAGPANPQGSAAATAEREPAGTPPDEELRPLLTGLLERHRGNVSEVAREMGKARMQIHRWMKRLGLDPETFRGS